MGLVSTAQSDVEADSQDDTDRRLVGRESSARVDAVVIALWSIAVGMTVMLGIFLWHTSPRRRLRLAAVARRSCTTQRAKSLRTGLRRRGLRRRGLPRKRPSRPTRSAEEATEPAEDEPGQRSV